MKIAIQNTVKAIVLIVLGTLLLPVMSAKGQVIVDLNPGQDARITSQNPDTNYGKGTQFSLANTAGQRDKMYFQFGLSGIDTTQTSSATFALTISLTRSFNRYYQLIAVTDDALETWNQTTITWNNAPASNPVDVNQKWDIAADPNPFDLAGTELVGAQTMIPANAAVGSKLSFTISDLSIFTQDTNDLVTLILIMQNESNAGFGFYTMKDTDPLNRPVLTLNVPEPGSVAVLAAGGLTLLCFRRRKAHAAKDA